MSSGQYIQEQLKTIIWIDSNVYDIENESTYQNNKLKFKDYNFLRFNGVDNALSFVKNNQYFQFNLFYVIVSGSLAEKFFSEYVKATEESNIFASTIIYCFNQEFHRKKDYFKDRFLNPGGITICFDKKIKKDLLLYVI